MWFLGSVSNTNRTQFALVDSKVAFIQKVTGNGNATATQWKLELLKREWLVYSNQFTEVFILNQLQFAATEYDSIY